MRRSLILGGAAVACGVVWSCVGDSVTGPPQGGDGGACFNNGTCNAGLVCTSPQGNGICVPGGSDASLDGPSSDAGPSPDATPDADAQADAYVCNPSIDASALASLLLNCQYDTCFSYGTDAGYCTTSTYVCGLGNGFNLQPKGCLGVDPYHDAGTCCIIGATLVDASCTPELVLTDGSFGFERASNCLAATGSPADLLCTSDAVCTKYLADASAKCVPVIFAGNTPLDGITTGVCQ